jgi:RapA N-terminal Tudor like domain 1
MRDCHENRHVHRSSQPGEIELTSGPISRRITTMATPLFIPGQRYHSNAEPELGLGTVMRVEGRAG